MRLVDKVAQTREPYLVELHGEIFAMPGASEFADDVRATPLRYIVDDGVRRLCKELVRRWPDLLDPGDPVLRLPAQQLWIEWVEGGGPQIGVLIRTTPDGRTGTVRTFWSDAYGAALAQAAIRFDFEAALHPGPCLFVRTLPDQAGLPSGLAETVSVEIEPRWEDYFARNRTSSEASAAARRHCAKLVVADFPFILAFSRLLQTPGNFDTASISREALNVSRMKRNRPVLLDHIEVSLRLGGSSNGSGHDQTISGTCCRRHVVRGHFVRRSGNVYWRSSHYRGSGNLAGALTRTVRASLPLAGCNSRRVMPAKGT